MRVLVAGATGQIGRHIVGQLLEAGHEVRALSRNPANANLPEGAEVVAGDLTDVTTLEPAFDGVEAAHLITFGGVAGEDLTNGQEIVDLAEKAGVKRISVLSGWGSTSVEEALEKGSIPWTLLSPVEVMINTLEWADEVRQKGTVSTLATWPSAIVHEADIASVAVVALTEDGHGGEHYIVTGPEAITPMDRVAALAAATGQPIQHVELTEEQERERLVGLGSDEGFIEFAMELALNPPEEAAQILTTVPDVTGKPGRTFAQWAEENAESFRQA